MTDLVERLRYQPWWAVGHDGLPLRDPLLDEAANEIERLHDHSVMLNKVGWRLLELLGEVGPDDTAKATDGDIPARLERLAAKIQQARADANAVISTISFLGSVIRCGEEYTPEVAQAIDNAYVRLRSMAGSR